ncbi:DCC1-like thiol-disulfide oxidoreductase family protein [Micromonospora sp. NPDC047134]|uniref:thiol-disulfide oxidoreductase DCC family protein n=1 Tax=Micromonospora sp. NPDC047134 TaxID=3154340 RepID=UPI00340EEAB6
MSTRQPTGGPPDASTHGGAGIRYLTVLYDAHCPICRTAREWLASQAQLVPLEFVPAGSAEARQRFPGLDHEATLRDITVVADDGALYIGDGAWIACLWALAEYRATAERLSRPHLLPLARGVVAAASAVREMVREPGSVPPGGSTGYGGPDDRPVCADDRCG